MEGHLSSNMAQLQTNRYPKFFEDPLTAPWLKLRWWLGEGPALQGTDNNFQTNPPENMGPRRDKIGFHLSSANLVFAFIGVGPQL